MSNKHFCQGPSCHTQVTQDRFLKSRGVIRGRYAYTDMNKEANGYYYFNNSDKYFCSKVARVIGYLYTWKILNMVDLLHLFAREE